MESSTGMSSGWMIWPLRKRAPLNSPGMIWVMSWQSTWPAASSVRISFISVFSLQARHLGNEPVGQSLRIFQSKICPRNVSHHRQRLERHRCV